MLGWVLGVHGLDDGFPFWIDGFQEDGGYSVPTRQRIRFCSAHQFEELSRFWVYSSVLFPRVGKHIICHIVNRDTNWMILEIGSHTWQVLLYWNLRCVQKRGQPKTTMMQKSRAPHCARSNNDLPSSLYRRLRRAGSSLDDVHPGSTQIRIKCHLRYLVAI
ncbi:hypothetical protein K469DRAFT_254384 [Zopfia rhizophila CBS 207.26]|uniref:Uncharacterized protein n=1 Tax=Zopfia rhizophila CBS 207.26 TaxID=1314779 RepID=A0A6A6DRH3_9PEZI|nr:hypothetical protein K469DRAFT_254384 [Zopfia rhizophila CBS 207.26]